MGIRRCAWCGRWLGLARGIPNGQVTHGICKRCLRREYASYPELQPMMPQREQPEAVILFMAAAFVGGGLGAALKPAFWDWWALRVPLVPAMLAGALVCQALVAAWFWVMGK